MQLGNSPFHGNRNLIKQQSTWGGGVHSTPTTATTTNGEHPAFQAMLCSYCVKIMTFSYTSMQAGTSQAEGRQVKVCLKMGGFLWAG